MYKLSIALLFLFIGNNVSAQKSSILYYLPDSVEIKVNNYIKEQKLNSRHIYLFLENANKDTFRINLCQYQKKNKKRDEFWISLTNRKVVIDKNRYPILLDYDYKFSTIDTLRAGVYGDRANNRTKYFPIYHCFSITFTDFYILDDKSKPIGYANKQHTGD